MKIELADSFKIAFKKLKKKYKSLNDDFEKLLDSLEDNPFQGDKLGRDCYKVRMAIESKNKGKSGGSRVITCVKIVDDTMIILTIYDKGEQSTIKEKELDGLLKEAGIE
jgi:mRNA-degrading endonuclease RelE of RelBE toxin-antitoxin system